MAWSGNLLSESLSMRRRPVQKLKTMKQTAVSGVPAQECFAAHLRSRVMPHPEPGRLQGASRRKVLARSRPQPGHNEFTPAPNHAAAGS